MSPNSHGKEEAASAASSLVIPENASIAQIDRMEQNASEAIDNVQDLEEAEAILAQVELAEHAIRLASISEERQRRWGSLRLRAERRYGELLPPKQPGKRTDKATSGSLPKVDPDQAKRARKVAAVSEAEFEEYIKNESNPTRSGLLRKTTPPPRERKREKNTPPEKAMERLQQRADQVRSTDSRVRPRWTLEDADDAEAVLKLATRRRKKYAGKRLREIAVKRRNGDELASLQHRILQLTAILESVDISAYDLADAEDVSFFHDDLVALQLWMDRSIELASLRLDDAVLERKISKLRDNMNGRTFEEQRTALAMADKLERRRRENRLTK